MLLHQRAMGITHTALLPAAHRWICRHSQRSQTVWPQRRRHASCMEFAQAHPKESFGAN